MLNLIVAVAENQVIGHKNKLPWYLPEDLRRFRELTMGHTVVMGRKTYESIGQPLPGRTVAVVTRSGTANYACIADPDTYFRETREHRMRVEGHEVFVAGGAQVYAAAMPYAQRIYLTRVHWTPPGDTFFPMLDDEEWERTAAEPRMGFTFEIWERRTA